jgi:hypothetical protein
MDDTIFDDEMTQGDVHKENKDGEQAEEQTEITSQDQTKSVLMKHQGKQQHNIGQSNIKSFTTPASKLKPTSQHTPPTPPSRED